MTLYVFPDPQPAVSAVLNAAKAARWPTAVIATAFPSQSSAQNLGVAWPMTGPWIQHAWDGTPTQESNRQGATIRVTVWQPKGKPGDAASLAQLVNAVLLDSGSASVWRFARGAGPLNGTDDDSGLPFCTFTVTAETRPTAVA